MTDIELDHERIKKFLTDKRNEFEERVRAFDMVLIVQEELKALGLHIRRGKYSDYEITTEITAGSMWVLQLDYMFSREEWWIGFTWHEPDKSQKRIALSVPRERTDFIKRLAVRIAGPHIQEPKAMSANMNGVLQEFKMELVKFAEK